MLNIFTSKMAVSLCCLSLMACNDEVSASHKAGTNCMSSNCHVAGGSGEGIFTVAGTVYKSGGGVQANATMTLFVRNTNTIVAALKTDNSGNFYTTDAVEGLVTSHSKLAAGVDVQVQGPGGIRNMSGVLTEGSCNLCHGDSVGKISAN